MKHSGCANSREIFTSYSTTRQHTLVSGVFLCRYDAFGLGRLRFPWCPTQIFFLVIIPSPLFVFPKTVPLIRNASAPFGSLPNGAFNV